MRWAWDGFWLDFAGGHSVTAKRRASCPRILIVLGVISEEFVFPPFEPQHW